MSALVATLPDACQNLHHKCEQWAMSGECNKNPNYMRQTCVKACGFCLDDGPVDLEEMVREQVAGRKAVRDDGARDDGALFDETESFEDGASLSGKSTTSSRIKQLFDRCKENARNWAAQQVAECVELANDGIEYRVPLDEPTKDTVIESPPTAEARGTPMSLANIIATNLTTKEKLLLGACVSYLAWYVWNRRRGATAFSASRPSKYRKPKQQQLQRLPTRM